MRFRRCGLALCASLVLLASTRAHAADDSASLAPAIESAAIAVQQGRLTTAIALLRPVVAAHPELSEARLLLAVAYFRHDEIATAATLFETLRSDGNRAIAETARTFLALIEAARGNDAASRDHLLQIDRKSPLGDATRPLLERAQPARLRVYALVEPGFDSNVGRIANLAQAPTIASTADGYVLFATSIGVRPLRRVAWQLETALSYRVHFSQRSYDFVAHQVATRYTWSRGRHLAWASVAFLTQALGGALLSFGPTGMARYRLALPHHLGLAFDYSGRYSRFSDPTYRFLTGHEHQGTVELWGGDAAWEVAIGYRPGGQIASDDAFSFHGHSAFVRGQWRRRFFELTAAIRGGASYYRLGRFDRYAGGELALGFDLRREVALVVDASLWRNTSTIPDFSYWRAMVGLGVVASYVGL